MEKSKLSNTELSVLQDKNHYEKNFCLFGSLKGENLEIKNIKQLLKHVSLTLSILP